MTNATAWDLGTAGWNSLTNQSNITVVDAAVKAWQQSGNGMAAIMVFSFIIFLAVFIVQVRTKNGIAASLVGIIMAFVVRHYNLMSFTVDLPGGGTWYAGQIMYAIYVILVIMFALGAARIFMRD